MRHFGYVGREVSHLNDTGAIWVVGSLKKTKVLPEAGVPLKINCKKITSAPILRQWMIQVPVLL